MVGPAVPGRQAPEAYRQRLSGLRRRYAESGIRVARWINRYRRWLPAIQLRTCRSVLPVRAVCAVPLAHPSKLRDLALVPEYAGVVRRRGADYPDAGRLRLTPLARFFLLPCSRWAGVRVCSVIGVMLAPFLPDRPGDLFPAGFRWQRRAAVSGGGRAGAASGRSRCQVCPGGGLTVVRYPDTGGAGFIGSTIDARPGGARR